MHPWIAIAVSMSLAQVSSEYPSPLDPSVRDNSAQALRDANEQAAKSAEGAWLPPNYVIQQMPGSDSPAYGAYGGGYEITPVLPDGKAPLSPGDAAIDETYQSYQPIPAPTPEPGATEEREPQGTIAESAATNAYGSGTQEQGTGGAGTGGAGVVNEASQPSAQDTMGGFGPTAEEQATSEQGTGGSGTSGTTTTPPGPSTTTGEASVNPSGATGAATPQPQSQGATSAGSDNTSPPMPSDTATSSNPGSTQPQTGASAAPQAPDNTTPPQVSATEVARLRERVDQLEAELNTRDDQLEQNTRATQEQVDTFGDRAVDTEVSRQQRLSALQNAGEWMLAADAALQQGDNDVDNALDYADSAFADIGSSASEFGQGTVTVHAERARALLNLARDAAGRSDTYSARLALQEAGVELSLARGASLGRSGTGNSLLTP
ncbi:hypothetical protein [Myxococcus stipitatus]|uniref:hypothetical protein n=1 Tax=Myxococcus stipitatus TaxID=83455 RepID=UPI0030D44CC8